MTAIRSIGIPLVLLSTLFLLQACGGGGGGGGDASEASSDLVLLDVNVDGTTGVPLNTVLKITFSEVLDPDSVRPETVQIRQGPNFGIQVPGRLLADGRDVYFSPRLPVDGDYEDSGFQPGTSYKVVLPGAPKVATVRSFSGDRLVREFEASFGTADSDGPLFIDNFLDPGPPQVTSVSPVDEAPDVSADSEITLVFKRRPLDPATVNSDTISVRLLERDGIVLDRPVEGTPVLEQTRESVHVTWKPRYPLASRAKYRISVSRFIVDLVGFDLVPHESTFTTRDELLRPGELVLEFDAPEGEKIVDTMVTTASWGTEVPGEMTALFTAAGGSGTAGDFRPNKDVEVSAEDFPNGVGVETIDGVETDVFNFREIDIPAGVTARFVRRPSGPNRPIALLALKNITIDGTLSVEGGKGESSESTYISNFSLPSADGGLSGPGGADGAARYAGSLNRSHPPADASDAPQGGGGGGGGFTGTGSTVYSASSGGGGGGSRTAGEDGGPAVPSSTSTWYAKVGGAGGDSASSRGFGPNLERRPNIGGAGGGAGGNGYYALTSSSSRSRNGAGTGGGGGGAVTIQSASDVVIGPEGKIDASGGNGGDIQSGMLAYYGGAGGGGEAAAPGSARPGASSSRKVRGST